MSSSTGRRDGEFSCIPITFPDRRLRIVDDELGPARRHDSDCRRRTDGRPRARYGELSDCCRAQQPKIETRAMEK